MSETFKTQESFTFEKLDFDKLIKLIRDFIKSDLSEVEINNNVIVTQGDLEKVVSLEDAHSAFTSGEFDLIHFAISQRWGNGNQINVMVSQKPNRLVISHNNLNPESGRKIIADFVTSLRLIDIYDSRLLKIKDKAERSYMEEALICRNSEALRAAVIMGWTCVMNRIYSKIEKKFKAQFISKIKQKHKNDKKFKLKTITLLEDYQQFKDKEVLEVSENLFLNKGLVSQLKQFLRLRNDCAHVRIWKPTNGTVDAFFDEIFANSF